MKSIAVSACLLGQACRYDGRSKPNKAVIDLGDIFNIIPICPETLGGLSTPRIPSEIKGEKVVRRDGVDVTAEYEKGAMAALEICQKNNVCAAVLKERSPACGKDMIYDGNFDGTLISGSGIAAKALMNNGIAVYGESEVNKLLEEI